MFGDIFNCQVWESATKIRNAAKHLNNAQDKPLPQRNIMSKMSIMPRLRNKREKESEKQCDLMKTLERICKGRYRRMDQSSRFKTR